MSKSRRLTKDEQVMTKTARATKKAVVFGKRIHAERKLAKAQLRTMSGEY